MKKYLTLSLLSAVFLLGTSEINAKVNYGNTAKIFKNLKKSQNNRSPWDPRDKRDIGNEDSQEPMVPDTTEEEDEE